MKIFILFLISISFFGVSFNDIAYPTEIANKNIYPSVNAVKDMIYHNGWYYYWTLIGKNWCLAGYFKPGDFGINDNIRIRTIGQSGYYQYGSANIYIFLSEVNCKPDCTPPDFSKKKYGPYSGSIGPDYADGYFNCDLYAYNWYITKRELDSQPNHRFWIIYHLSPGRESPPPYPISDDATDNKNSLTWDPSKQDWCADIINLSGSNGYKPCWTMRCIVEYPPNVIEYTSIGTVKSLFK